MGVLKQFHLEIKYKKGTTNTFINIILRTSTSMTINLGTLMHMDPFIHKVFDLGMLLVILGTSFEVSIEV